MMDLHDPMPVTTRRARRDGVPIFCDVCGVICHPTTGQPSLCVDHVLDAANRAMKRGRTIQRTRRGGAAGGGSGPARASITEA